MGGGFMYPHLVLVNNATLRSYVRNVPNIGGKFKYTPDCPLFAGKSDGEDTNSPQKTRKGRAELVDKG